MHEMVPKLHKLQVNIGDKQLSNPDCSCVRASANCYEHTKTGKKETIIGPIVAEIEAVVVNYIFPRPAGIRDKELA